MIRCTAFLHYIQIVLTQVNSYRERTRNHGNNNGGNVLVTTTTTTNNNGQAFNPSARQTAGTAATTTVARAQPAATTTVARGQPAATGGPPTFITVRVATNKNAISDDSSGSEKSGPKPKPARKALGSRPHLSKVAKKRRPIYSAVGRRSTSSQQKSSVTYYTRYWAKKSDKFTDVRTPFLNEMFKKSGGEMSKARFMTAVYLDPWVKGVCVSVGNFDDGSIDFSMGDRK